MRAPGESLPSPLLKFLPRAHTQHKKSLPERARAHPRIRHPSSLPRSPSISIDSCGHLEPPLVIVSYWFAVRTLSCDWPMRVRALLAHWLVRAVHEREGKSCKRKARAGKAEARRAESSASTGDQQGHLSSQHPASHSPALHLFAIFFVFIVEALIVGSDRTRVPQRGFC